MPPDQSPMVQHLPGQTTTNALAPGHQYTADRSVSDVGDPYLGWLLRRRTMPQAVAVMEQAAP